MHGETERCCGIFSEASSGVVGPNRSSKAWRSPSKKDRCWEFSLASYKIGFRWWMSIGIVSILIVVV